MGHIRYAHKTCAGCGAVQDRNARVCGSCGAKLSSRAWQVLARIGLTAPDFVSISGLLGALCVVAYVGLVADGGGGIVSVDTLVLFRHGGNVPEAVAAGDWWRWGTAVFLHAGLWHIGFNLFALATVGPHIEDLYGRWATAALFLATGVAGNAGSGAMGLAGVGIGASGAVMGLIGAAAAAGHRDGTGRGRAIRNDMLKWTAYVMLFGLFIGADNWAHAFGFASGAAFGLAVRPRWLTRIAVRRVVAVVGVLAVAACGLATYATLRPPASRFEQRFTDDRALDPGPPDS